MPFIYFILIGFIVGVVCYYNYIQVPEDALRFYKTYIHKENDFYYIYFRPFRYIPVYRLWYKNFQSDKSKRPIFLVYIAKSLEEAEKLLK